MTAWAVTTAADGIEFDTQQALYGSCRQIDSNHFINFWSGVDYDGYVQVFTVNTTTWAVTTANDPLEFDTISGQHNSCFAIDSNHFINFWSGDGADGYVQVFTVNTTTWAVTTANNALEFDTVNSSYNSCFAIDSNHFINFWAGSGSDGYVQVFTVNTTTWAVTTANNALEFDTQTGFWNSCYQIDSNHFINFWSGSSDRRLLAQVFTVNTSTWAVTTANDPLNLGGTFTAGPTTSQVDSNHFVVFFEAAAGLVQTLTINTSTWAVTTANTSLNYSASIGGYNSCFAIDSNHFINFWAGNGNDGYVQVFTVSTTTWAVTTANDALEFDTVNGQYNSCFAIDSNHFINFWAGNGNDGYVQAFTVELPGAGPSFLSAWARNSNSILKVM